MQPQMQPSAAERMWEHRPRQCTGAPAQVGLLAPQGEIDKVLQTVVNNLLLTNSIDLQSEVRCRVLLTALWNRLPSAYHRAQSGLLMCAG